jgi:hypothetical protein
VMMVSVRTPEEIVRGLPRSGGRLSKAVAMPADFAERGAKLRTYAFAGDYRFFSQKDMRGRCANVQYPRAGLFVEHIPFAESGQGDTWCVRARSDRSLVTFLDHDDEVDAVPYDVKIDLAGQVETAIANDRALLDARLGLKPHPRKLLHQALERISRGLSKRLPIRIR